MTDLKKAIKNFLEDKKIDGWADFQKRKQKVVRILLDGAGVDYTKQDLFNATFLSNFAKAKKVFDQYLSNWDSGFQTRDIQAIDNITALVNIDYMHHEMFGYESKQNNTVFDETIWATEKETNNYQLDLGLAVFDKLLGKYVNLNINRTMEEATQLAEFIPNMKVRVIYNHDDTYDAKGYDPEVVRKLIKADLDERTLGSINHEGEGFSLVYNNHQKGNNELSLHFREYTPVVEEILKRIEL